MFCILGSDFIEICMQHSALKLTNFCCITEMFKHSADRSLLDNLYARLVMYFAVVNLIQNAKLQRSYI